MCPHEKINFALVNIVLRTGRNKSAGVCGDGSEAAYKKLLLHTCI